MERYYNILKHSLYQKILQSLEFYEKERKFCCHNLEHFCDVARIMYIFALEEQSELTKDLIYATALLHDIGRAKEYSERINEFAEMIKESENVVFFGGAGVSTESGIST